MFRRRPLRRAIMGRPPLGEPARRALMHGHHLMETGNYAEAAQVFERLASEAQARGMLPRAPQLYFQASRARMLAGQVPQALDLLYKGLQILADTQHWQHLYKAGLRAVEGLKQQGHPKEAEQVQAWIDAAIKDHPEAKQAALEAAAPARPRHIPAKCPFCGGSIRPNEVEWLDETTAECPYCGSSVQSEE
ncbi:MAG: hypothetical protein AB1894_03390 [Chloroflexota bacterium]